MSIDLINALTTPPAEPVRAPASRGDSAFPELLRSSVAERESASTAETAAAERPDADVNAERSAKSVADEADPDGRRAPERETKDASADSAPSGSTPPAEARPEDGSEARGSQEEAGTETEAATAEAAAQGAALGTQVFAEVTRDPVTREALQAAESQTGRLTDLAEDPNGNASGMADSDLDSEVRSAASGGAITDEEVLEGVRGALREEAAAAETSGIAAGEREGESAIQAGTEATAGAGTGAAVESQIGFAETVSREPGVWATESRSEVPASPEGRAEVVTDGRVDPGTLADSEASPEEEREGSAGQQERAAAERAAEISASTDADVIRSQTLAQAEIQARAPETVAVDGAAAVPNPVAGGIAETTTTAPPGGSAPAAATDAIAVQTEWLATRGGGTARLVLHPPDLGEIAIRVTTRGGAVDVVMVAHEATARAIAEEQSDRLAQAFAGRDLRMENFEVRRGDPQSLSESDLSQFSDSGTPNEGRPGDERAGEGHGPSRANVNAADPILNPARVAPQILTTGPEPSVDLRI